MHLMEIAARWAWETSIATCVLIAPALFAAVALRKAAFTSLRYVLGLLVVARLLMPLAIPSPLSVFNLFRPSGERTLTLPTISRATPAPTLVAQPTESTDASKYVALRRSLPILPILWACGAIAILARVFWQHYRVRRWIAGGAEITDGPAIDALQLALKVAKRQRQLRVYAITELKTAALFGIFRPAILLPREFVANGDLTRLRLVFLHEIAHLRRMDVLVNWLGIFARALHWFNPLVWLTLRRLRVDQELLCDRDVMRTLHPEEHHSYGETLLALASPRGFEFSTLIPVSSNFKQLKERIAMIKQFKPATNRLLLFALPPLAALLAIVTFTAATEKKPAKPPATDDREVQSSDSTRLEKAKKAIAQLEQQWKQQTDRVRQQETFVDELRRNVKIFPAETASDLQTFSAETVRQIEQDRIRAEHELIQYQRLLKELKSKSRQEQIQAIPTAYRDEALDRLLQDLRAAEQRKVTLNIDYTDDNPDVQRATVLIKEINRQIDGRLAGVLDGLQTLVSSRRAVTEALEKELEEIKVSESQRLEQARPYFNAKQDLEAQQKLRDSIYIRILQEKVDSGLAN